MRRSALGLGVVMFMLGVTLTHPPEASAQEAYTPIPVIKGMELLAPGTKAPLFSVKDVEGKPFEFAQEIGKAAYLMVFWSIYCEPCRDEMPMIEKVANQYAGKGLQVLSINLDGDPFAEAVKGFLKQGKYSFRVLMDELEDENFKIADPYNVAGTPVIYLVGKNGEIAFNILGRVSPEDLTAKIDQALATP